MTCSMTAFARLEKQADWGHAVWELRSVNHRYLEISLSLPEPLNNLEPQIRKQLTNKLRRGRVDVKLHYKPTINKAVPIEIDEDLTKAIIQVHLKLSNLAQSSLPLNPNELLRWPHLLKIHDNFAHNTLRPDLLALFSETLVKLCLARADEGKAIFILIKQRLTKIQNLIYTIKKQLPTILLLQRKKILARLADMQTSIDPNRLEQEMLLFTQKTDVAEELDRLQIHINEFNKLLEKEAQGKPLDFLLQELNREVNTLASKSLNADLSLMAVNLKVLIEEIREQVQNVE
ncbi:MAG: YicC/YloC family endoribonuclease [Rickettsiella sp.]|nr:YicC/YloC family endoribonuclease [Rickettsiella sp.]